MATATVNEPQDLRTLFTSAEKLKSEIEGSYDYNSEWYIENLKIAIEKFKRCKERLAVLGLFSPNEPIEDVASSELRFMLIDFYLGELAMKEQGADRQAREATLGKSKEYYKQFLRLCDDYKLITTKEDTQMYADLVIGQATSPQALDRKLRSDPGAKRLAKIARYKQEKQLSNQLETLSKLANDDYPNVDEDAVRNLFLTKLSLSITQALQAIEGILLELDVLLLAPLVSSHPVQDSQQVSDGRERRLRDGKDDGYSDRLDHPSIFQKAKGRALLDREGRPLQPFELLDKRNIIRKGVFRPGHNLPTMTIQEYLDEEWRRGNIIEGGGEKSWVRPEPDEDNYEKADGEIMKARKWDEFKEENPRGSGNRMNMG